MLIPFDELFRKYKVDATGVLHIGASTGQEVAHYYNNGIKRSIWIEAIPEVYEELKRNIAPYPGAIAYNECISDMEDQEVEFNVSSNRGESSSFLELGTHAIVHPDVTYVRKFKAKTNTISRLFHDHGHLMSNYTFLNIDLQGAELFALKGMRGLIDQVNYAYLEVNKDHLYKGCALVDEIDAYLAPSGFKRVETLWAGNTGWGDAFYVQQALL